MSLFGFLNSNPNRYFKDMFISQQKFNQYKLEVNRKVLYFLLFFGHVL